MAALPSPASVSVVPSNAPTPGGGQGADQPMAIGQGPAAPDGRSPNARAGKRTRQAADAPAAGGPGALSVVELTEAVQIIQPDLKVTQDAVEHNASLLNALITRVNLLEGWTQMAEPKLTSFEAGLLEMRNWVEQTSPKLLELDGFGVAVENAIGKANEVAAHADGRLRSEIGQMTMIIDRAVSSTTARMDDLSAGLSALEISVSMPAAVAAGASAGQADGPAPEAFGRVLGEQRELRRITEALKGRVEIAEGNVSRHEGGLRDIFAKVALLDGRQQQQQRPPTTDGQQQQQQQQQQQAGGQQPQQQPTPAGFGAEHGANFSQGGPTTPAGESRTGASRFPGRSAEQHDIGSNHDVHGRPKGTWKLYDEKYMFLRESAYRAKEPQSWFNDLRDYPAGRTPELDQLFIWIEKQTEFVRHDDESVMSDCAKHEGQPAAVDAAWSFDQGRPLGEEDVCERASSQRLRSLA